MSIRIASPFNLTDIEKLAPGLTGSLRRRAGCGLFSFGGFFLMRDFRKHPEREDAEGAQEESKILADVLPQPCEEKISRDCNAQHDERESNLDFDWQFSLHSRTQILESHPDSTRPDPVFSVRARR